MNMIRLMTTVAALLLAVCASATTFLSIADARIDEGNSGTTNMLFPVTLSAASGTTTTVSYFTSGNDAYISEDYQHTSGTLTFNPGETQKIIAVGIVGETKFEADETFSVYIHSATNATIARSMAIGTIVNDDVQPLITITGDVIAEGNSGQSDAVITLTANLPLYGLIGYSTSDSTAKAGTDYVYSSGSVLFNGETTKSFSIAIIGDTNPEPDETVWVFIASYTGGAPDHNPFQLRILNDDASFAPLGQKVALGTDAGFTLDLGAVPGSPFTLTPISSNPSVLDPSPITISQRVTPIIIPAKAVGSATITATLPSPYSKSFTTSEVYVYEPASLVLNPASVVIQEGESINLSASFQPEQKSASTVKLRAANKTIFDTPASIVIEPGKTTVFTIKALKKGSSALVTTLGADHGDVQSTFFVDVTEGVKTPLITQITPANGPVTGGTNVTISGANLPAGCAMFFGGAPATNFVFGSASSMTATTPARPAGAVDVLLSCGANSFNFANAFTYLPSSPVMAGVAPSSGATAGGTLVRLTGTNFRSDCWPFFDGVAARSTSFVSSTEVIGEVPAHAAGKVTVALRCSGGEGTLADGFTYSTGEEPAPLINSVAPLAASPGQAVTITGARFRSDDTVTFNGLPAAILSTSPDKDVVRVPEMPAGGAAITLTDNAGHATTTGPIFTVLEPVTPRINSATPTIGRPGTDIVLDGIGFRPGYAFAFGTARAGVASLRYTRVLLRVPDIAPGAYPLNVIDAAGKIASIGPLMTVAATGPSISNIMPACATTDGGGTMSVTGGGFEPGTTVTFDGIIATVRVIDVNTLSIVIPAGAVGSSRIMITNPSGGSASLTGAFTYFSPFDPNRACSGGRSRPLRH